MRIKFIILISLMGCIFLNTKPLSAQTLSLENIQNIKISQLSDQQILDIWQKFQTSGMSEEIAYQQLKQRGLPSGEIDAFKKRLAEIQSSGITGKAAAAKRSPDIAPVSRDTIIPTLPQVNSQRNRVYGYDFFNNSTITFEPDLRIATPRNYILGPDDEVVIMVNGLNETTISKKIKNSIE